MYFLLTFYCPSGDHYRAPEFALISTTTSTRRQKRNMSSDSQHVLLREARELYERVASAAAATDADGGSSTLDSLNRAVRTDVAAAVKEPLSEVFTTAREGVAAARALSGTVGDLPGTAQDELRDLPKTANLDALGDAPTSIRTVAATLSAASKDPSLLYPRLLCGSIPVDPARVGRALAKVNLDSLNAASGDAAPRSVPKSSEEVTNAVALSFAEVADPLVEGLDTLSSVRSRLTKCGEAATDLSRSADGDALGGLAGVQEQVTGLVDRFMSLFTGGDDASVTGNKDDLVSDRSAPKDCVQAVDEGSELVRSAGELRGPLEKCIAGARALGEKVAALLHELKELFAMVVEAFGKIIELLKRFFAKLPLILEQVKKFFIPAGFNALFMVTSDDTKSLVAAVDNLKTSVPQADSVENARGLVTESKSVSKAEGLIEKLKEIVQMPIALMDKLGRLSEELPEKIIEAAKKALATWVQKYGVDAIGDKIEDGLVNVAGKIGGDKLANAVGNFLPFGDDDEGEGNKKPGGIFGSFF